MWWCRCPWTSTQRKYHSEKHDDSRITYCLRSCLPCFHVNWLFWGIAETSVSLVSCLRNKINNKTTSVNAEQNIWIYTYKLSTIQKFSTLIIIRHVSWAANQHIRMISEGSCDTKDWTWIFSFAIIGINYILKYIKIENSCFFEQGHDFRIFD